MIPPKSRIRRYWIFRLFNPSVEGDLYVYDVHGGYRERSSWSGTSMFSQAHEFHSRGDAARVKRSAWVKRYLMENPSWFWEVVRITETLTTTYEVEFEDSDAPAMVAIARATS